MKKLITAACLALALTFGCATVQVPKNVRIEIVSVVQDVVDKVKDQYPDMSVIGAIQVEVEPGKFARLEVYDFDGNGQCDDNGLDGGIMFIKDPSTNNLWVMYDGPFSCADSKTVFTNIQEAIDKQTGPQPTNNNDV